MNPTDTTRGRATVSRTVRLANRVLLLLLRAGVPVGPMRVLTVPGRRSGEPRRTPVTPVEVGGERYLVQAFSRAAWVKNAQASGCGRLGRGRHQDGVRLAELDIAERAAVLRELPRVAARAAGILVRNGVVAAPTPEAFAAAAPSCVVFRVDR